MRDSDSVVRTLEIRGAPAEMGAAHGEECRSEINALFEKRCDIVCSENSRLSPTRLEAACVSIWAYVAERYYDLAAEIEATAMSAHLQPWQMVVAGAYTDVLDVCRERSESGRDECTVGVNASRRFIAGTWDTHMSAVDALLLLTRRPKKGPATLALTTAGWPAQQGVNDAGLAFAITNLTPRKASPSGLPYIAANALLAGSSTAHEFVQLARSERFCSGHAYVIVDSTGSATMLETTDHGIDAWPVEHTEAHANHYRATSMLDDNSAYKYLKGSCAREAEFAEELNEIVDPETFSHVLLGSRRINRVVPEGGTVTAAHFFLDASAATVWYQRGPAIGAPLRMAKLT